MFSKNNKSENSDNIKPNKTNVFVTFVDKNTKFVQFTSKNVQIISKNRLEFNPTSGKKEAIGTRYVLIQNIFRKLTINYTELNELIISIEKLSGLENGKFQILEFDNKVRVKTNFAYFEFVIEIKDELVSVLKDLVKIVSTF